MADYIIDIAKLEAVETRPDGSRTCYGFIRGKTRSGNPANFFVPGKILLPLRREIEQLTPPGMLLEEVGLSVRLTGEFRPDDNGSKKFHMEAASIVTGPEAELRMVQRQSAVALQEALEHLASGRQHEAMTRLLSLTSSISATPLPSTVPGLDNLRTVADDETSIKPDVEEPRPPSR